MKTSIKALSITAIFVVTFCTVQSQTMPKSQAGGQPVEPFVIGQKEFLLHGSPFVIRCGEMHFARIPKAYWRQRLKMAKAMGLNTICVYLFWNLHEPEHDTFQWTGQADAAAFCRLAQEEGLYVLLRPGPYSCAEWDFGGLPWWLLQKENLKIRSQDAFFLERSRLYLNEVGRILAPLQIDRGGNILLVQVENEYGSYGTDTVYIGKIRDQLRDAGFTVPLFTCDGPAELKNDTRNDIFPAVNFGSDPENAFSALRKIRPSGPLMVSEYYPGWFDSWGGIHHTGPADKIVKDITYMLDHQASFSIYMVHGGTSFGLWAGANANPYLPETTSYDYDAPITENGVATPKYYQLRTLLSKYLQPGEILPDVPDTIPVQTLAPFYCKWVAPILDQQTSFIKRDTILNMESVGEGYGDILYETMLPAGDTATLDVTGLHDYALVYLNDQFIGQLDRRKDEHLLQLPQRMRTENKLRIFVEAMGRVNWGPAMIDRKGLTGAVSITGHGVTTRLTNWHLYKFPLGEGSPPLTYRPVSGAHVLNQPALYKARFITHSHADVFLDVSRFNKGLVWVNGHCLGRYWNIGPTQTMYLPGVWLKNGRNEVVVMDLYKPSSLLLQGLKKPVL